MAEFYKSPPVKSQEVDTATEKAVDFVKINAVRVACTEKALGVIGVECHITGSRSEGVHVGSSDTDIIIESIDIEVVFKNSLSTNDHLEVLVDTSFDKPGYAMLRLKHDDLERDLHILKCVQKPAEFLCDKIGETYYLSNKKSIEAVSMFAASTLPWSGGLLTQIEINGPAKHVAVEMGQENSDIDILYVIPCRQIMQEIITWQGRERTWPSSKILEQASALPVFLVPVGHRLSSPEVQDCQWKFSFNLQERILMRSLNGPQIICCNILKGLKYHLKENQEMHGIIFDESILKSYFFKTCFFWKLEQIPNTEWNNEKIIPNTILCLQYFKTCLKKRCIPHYFIPNQNLLEGRGLDTTDTFKFENFLSSICDIDHPLWEYLLNKVITLQNKVYMKKQPIIDAVSTCRNLMILSVKTTSQTEALKALIQQKDIIEHLPTDTGLYDTDFKESIIMALQSQVGTLQCLLGMNGINLLRETVKFDFCSAKLKIATVFYWMGNLDEAFKITGMVIERNATNIMYYTGFTHVKDPNFKDLDNCMKDWKSLMTDNIYYDLLFIPAEKELCLPAVQLQLCEGRGFVINPLVYAHYLQFCIMQKMDFDKIELRDFLHNLQKLIDGGGKAGFHFTDWEIVSYCYLQLGDFTESYQNLIMAMKKQHTGMAQYWLLALLVFQCWQVSKKT